MDLHNTFALSGRGARASHSTARTRTVLFRAALVVFVLLPVVDLAIFLVARVWLHGDYMPTLNHVRIWIRSTLFQVPAMSDSWGPMRAAIDWLNGHSVGNVYEQLFFVDHIKFQYPLTSLLPLRLLSAFRLEPSDAVLNNIGGWVIVLNAVVCGAFAFVLASRSETNERFRWQWAIFATLATFSYFPLQKAFLLGQVQVWNNALFALAALAWLLGRRSLAGALIGVICLLKPQFALFIVWGLLRREWRFCAGWLCVTALGGAVSLYLFGVQNHLGYLAVLHALSRTGEAFIANQSINGFLNRVVGTDSTPRIWKEYGFPAFSPVVYLGTLMTSLTLIGSALLVPLRTRARSGMFDFVGGALSFTLASPIAWEHHYGVVPVIYLALVLSLATRAPSKARSIAFAVLIASYVLTDLWLSGSWMLCGALALLGLVYWSMLNARNREPATYARAGSRFPA